jgi:hypothetical protein
MIRYLQTFVGPPKVKAGREFFVSVPGNGEGKHGITARTWIFFSMGLFEKKKGAV